MSHDAEQLLGAHALGALDAEDLEAVEQHLEGCSSCRETLAEYQQAAHGLLHLTAARTPDPALREWMVRAVAPADRGEEGRGYPSKSSAPDKIRGRLRRPQAAWAAIGLTLVAVNVFLFAQLRSLSARSEQLLAQQYANQTALAVMTYPSSRVANLEQDSVRGSLIYDETLTLGVLNVWGLDPLEADQAYQLWLIDQEGERTSGGLVTPSERNAFVSLVVRSPVEFEFIQSIGLTIEPAGGSASPTGPRVLGTDLVHSP